MTAFKPALADRMRKLEQELFSLRRELAPYSEPPSADFEVLQVQVHGHWFSLILEHVQEVLPMVWPRPLPDSPPWLLGTFHIDGAVVPVIDLRQRLFSLEEKPSPANKIVLLAEPRLTGFVVDDVGEIDQVIAGSLTPPSKGISHAPYLLGTYEAVNMGTIPVLALERLSGDFAFDHEVV